MSKAVLISIHPEWCEKIASGQKTIEVRKTRPKIETPFKCYLYETKAINHNKIIVDLDGELPTIYAKGMGKIIGEFLCRDVEPIIPYGCLSINYDTPRTRYTDLIIKSGLYPVSKLIDYLGYNKGYAWHISDLVIYDKPKELRELRAQSACTYFHLQTQSCSFPFKCNRKRRCASISLTRPPQSWCYVEES